MVRLIAHRPLFGDYGAVDADEIFDCDEDTAESLQSRGLASRYVERKAFPPPVVVVHAKAVEPMEDKAIHPQDNKRIGRK